MPLLEGIFGAVQTAYSVSLAVPLIEKIFAGYKPLSILYKSHKCSLGIAIIRLFLSKHTIATFAI